MLFVIMGIEPTLTVITKKGKVFMKQIPLTKGYFALVDDDDYPIASQHKWTYDNGYAVRKATIAKGQYKKILLHRFLISAQPGQMVDHANRNSLDNRRCNLRLCTGSQNNANRRVLRPSSSPYRGVRKASNVERWEAAIGYNYRFIHLGSFLTQEEAARAYDAKAIELYGEFASTNFPKCFMSDLNTQPAD